MQLVNNPKSLIILSSSPYLSRVYTSLATVYNHNNSHGLSQPDLPPESRSVRVLPNPLRFTTRATQAGSMEAQFTTAYRSRIAHRARVYTFYPAGPLLLASLVVTLSLYVGDYSTPQHPRRLSTPSPPAILFTPCTYYPNPLRVLRTSSNRSFNAARSISKWAKPEAILRWLKRRSHTSR